MSQHYENIGPVQKKRPFPAHISTFVVVLARLCRILPPQRAYLRRKAVEITKRSVRATGTFHPLFTKVRLSTNLSLAVPAVFVAASMLMISNSVAFASSDPMTIVFLGDSLSAGFGLDESEAYPALVRSRLEAEGIATKVVNAGVSGDTTAGGLRRIDWILRAPCHMIVVALGGNDGLRGVSPAASEENLRGIVRKIKGKSPATIIVIAGMKVPPNMGAEYAAAFEGIFAKVAETEKLPLIPFLLEGVAGERALNQADGIHPTAEGQKIIAATVTDAILPLVRTLQTTSTAESSK